MAPAAGEDLIPLGFWERSFDAMHELGADSLPLAVGMDDEPADRATAVCKRRPYGAHDLIICDGSQEELGIELGLDLGERLRERRNLPITVELCFTPVGQLLQREDLCCILALCFRD